MLTFLLTLALNAPGDAIYIGAAESVTLTYAQKQDLASAVASTFPGVKPASLDKYQCWANPPMQEDRAAIDLVKLAAGLPWPCYAIDTNPTVTDSQALDLEIATGGACQIIDTPSTHMLCEQKAMNDDAKVLNSAFTQSVFSRPLALNWIFVCDRDKKDIAEIVCRANPILIKSASAWRAERKVEGKVVGTIGRVK